MNNPHKMKDFLFVYHDVTDTITPANIKQERPDEARDCDRSFDGDSFPEIELYSREDMTTKAEFKMNPVEINTNNVSNKMADKNNLYQKKKNKKLKDKHKVLNQFLWSCCDKEFDDFVLFNQHKEREHHMTPLECSVCTGLSLPSLTDLKKHYVDVHMKSQPSSFKCHTCYAVFGVQTSFYKHKKRASCPKAPNTDITTLRHTAARKITAKRKKLGRGAVVKEPDSFHLVCCEQTYVNFTEFNVHKFVKHRIELLVCGLCSREKKSTRALYKHYLQIHFPNCIISINNHKLKRKPATEVRRKTSTRKVQDVPNDRDECSSESEMSCDGRACKAPHVGILCECSTCTKLVGTFQPANETDKIDSTDILKPYVCKICTQRFTFGSRLKKHLHTHLGFKEHPCDICGNSFTKKTSLSKHKLYKHSSNPLKVTCGTCCKVFVCKSSLQKHVRNVHLCQGKNVPVECKYCEKTFAHPKSLNRHINDSHLRGREFICDHCGRVFYDKGILTYHIKSVHLPQEITICEICGYIASNNEALIGHQHRKHSQKRFGCEMCGKMFPIKRSLEMHLVGHFDEKPYICQTCGKGFKREANLQQHQYTHTEDRPHVCSVCGQSFRLRSHAKQHMAVHGLVKNHKCLVCGQLFAKKGELTLHLSDHAWRKELMTSTVSH